MKFEYKSTGEVILTGENLRTWRETCNNTTFPSQNLYRLTPRLNHGLCSKRLVITIHMQVTNSLNNNEFYAFM